MTSFNDKISDLPLAAPEVASAAAPSVSTEGLHCDETDQTVYIYSAQQSYRNYLAKTIPSALATLTLDLVNKHKNKINRMKNTRDYDIDYNSLDDFLIVDAYSDLVNAIAGQTIIEGLNHNEIKEIGGYQPAIMAMRRRAIEDHPIKRPLPYDTVDHSYDQPAEPTSLVGAARGGYQTMMTVSNSLPGVNDSIFTKVKKCYNLYNASLDVDADFITSETIDWSIAAAQLAMNPSMANMFLSLIRQLNRIFKMDLLTEQLLSYIKMAFEQLKAYSLTPLEPTLGEEGAYPTSLNETTYAQANNFISLLSSVGDHASTVAAILSSIVVAITTMVLGRDILSPKDAKPLLLKLGMLGTSLNGCKRGFDALKSMLGEVEKWILIAINHIVGRENQNALMQVILDWDIEDDGEFEKAKLFEHVDFLLHPINYDAIRSSDPKRRLLLRVTGFIQQILQKHSMTPLGISRSQADMLQRYLTELKVLRMSAYRCSDLPITRFTPMWVNFYGKPGTGKSTFMTRCCTMVMDALWKAGDFGVSPPDGDEPRIFPMNFCDEYMTGYCGQYSVTIDDIFQDSGSAATTNNSAYKMINLVSNTPYRTVQAAIEDKGLPFNSKMVWSTSNIRDPNRKEINSQGALLDRITVQVEMRFKEGACAECVERNSLGCKNKKCQELIDPLLGKPVEIVMLHLRADKSGFNDGKPFPSAEKFIEFLFDRYKNWWAHQNYVMDLHYQDRDYSSKLADQICSGEVKVRPLGSNTVQVHKTKVQIITEAEVNRATQTDEGASATSWMSYLPWRPKPLSSLQGLKAVNYNLAGDDLVILDISDVYTVLDREIEPEYFNFAFLRARLSGRTQLLDIREWLVVGNTIMNKFTDAQRRFNELCKSTWEQFKNHYMGKTVLMFFAGLASWYVLKGIKCDIRDHTIPQETSVRYQITKPTRLRPIKAVTRAPVVKPTSSDFFPVGHDPSGATLLNMLEERGCVGTVCVVNERIQSSTCVRVKGAFVLVNHHFFDLMPEGEVLQFAFIVKGNKQAVQQVYDPDRVTRLGNKDLALYECDERMMAAKDITSHFSDDCMSAHSQAATIVLTGGIPRDGCIATPDKVPNPYPSTKDNPDATVYEQIVTWSVNRESYKGDSGSLLISRDPRLQHRILGLQSCFSRLGNVPKSYFVPVARSELEEVMNRSFEMVEIPDIDVTATSLCVRASFPEPETAKSTLLHLGRVSNENVMQQPSKTRYIPSAVHDSENRTHEPAILTRQDPRLGDLKGCNLLARNMAGFDKVTSYLCMKTFLIAVQAIIIKYSTELNFTGIPRRLLSDFEMVNGIFNCLNAFDMRTSPGFPWVKKREQPNVKGKFEWFNETIHPDGAKTYEMKESLRDAVRKREEEASKGKRVVSISYACLKDETRKLEKIAACKTRVFVCMPMDFNLLVRKYFGAFVATMHSRAGDMPACVGLDPGAGWTGLVKRMMKVGNNWEDFDYGGWDTALHPEFFRAFARTANKWYGVLDDSDEGRVRLVLLHEVVYNYIIAGDRLLLKTTGNTSGCAITAELNSFINELMMLYFWFRLAPRDLDLDYYYDNVELAVYGDDVLKNVSEEAKFFSGVNLLPLAEELGMTMTDGSKKTDFRFKNLSEVSFLKRGFREDGRYWRAPLEKCIVENIPQWVHESDDLYNATLVNCETSLREAAQYGREYYNDLQNDLNGRIMRKNVEMGDRLLSARANPFEYYIGQSLV